MQRSLIQRKESYIWRTTGYGFGFITFLTLYQRFAFQTPVYCSPLCWWFLSLCHLSESYFRCSATSQAWGTEWQNLWQMQFNSKKCSSMCITLKKYLPPINFRFCGQILENVTSHPYLCVQLDSKLCWKEHIEFVVKSANVTQDINTAWEYLKCILLINFLNFYNSRVRNTDYFSSFFRTWFFSYVIKTSYMVSSP